MNISNFSLSQNGENLNVTIEDAANANSLFLFTDKTYKDFDLAIDLTNLLTLGVAVQSLQISLVDLNIEYFDGIYYIEANDDTDIASAFTYALTKYEECIIEKILKINKCDDCLGEKSISLINAQATLNGVKLAVKNGFIQEGINLMQNLRNYCSNKCKSCGELDNVINNQYLSYNDQ